VTMLQIRHSWFPARGPRRDPTSPIVSADAVLSCKRWCSEALTCSGEAAHGEGVRAPVCKTTVVNCI